MKQATLLAILAGTATSLFAAEPVIQSRENEPWNLLKEIPGITIYTRPHGGSRLKEFKAVGEIDAPTQMVHMVIDDIEAYPKFMPYTAECRLLKREGDSIFTYQRLSPKIVGDRDYTLRVRKQSWPAENGLAYLNRWEPANEHGPAEKPGVFRVKFCEGSWLLEPIGTDKTRATYCIYTDSGVAVPSFIANSMSELGIKKLFAAVRKQVNDPKYRAK
jgi:hypothetical protein